MFPHRPKSRVWFAGTALLTLLFVPGPVPADIYYETVYLPTSSVSTLATSNLLSTSYVVPTSLTSTYIPTSYTSTYIPTSYTSTYIPTSYTSTYIPTSYNSTYIPTSTVLATDSVLVPTTTTYYRPSIFRSRRYVERTSYSYVPTSTILPTSYLLPTSYKYLAPTSYVRSSIVPTSYLVDDSLVTTSMPSLPCETATSVAPIRSTGRPTTSNNGNGQSIISQPSNVGSSTERRPSSSMNSTPSTEEGTRSDVPPPATIPSTTPPVPPKAVDPGTLQQPPVVGEGGSAPKPPTPGATGGNDAVVVPGPGQSGNPATPPNETMSRQVKKPVYDTRNILKGKVISADTRQAEEGITVILSNPTRTFVDRQALTDAFGEFKISLPDGDWTVKVKMPSGSIVAVGQEYVTASSGKITDATGRGVGELVITR